ncbi:acyltransferase [Serratia fonticola]|uniref:acyltransferase n=1 Tax=Serratia fonticola TaxID=47917 RepID=UPI003AAE0C78
MIREHSGISLLRIIAAFLVVFIHVSPEVFSVMSNHWLGINVMASASRISVPLFFMISGYLAFNENKITKITHFLKKKFSRILIPLIAWSIFYIFYDETEVDIKILLNLLTATPAHYHLWFFYTIIPMILLTPFFSSVVRKIDYTLFIYFIVIWLFLSLTPSLIQALIYFTNAEDPILKVGKAQLFISMSGYFLLGGFLRKMKFNLNNWVLISAFLISTTATIISTIIISNYLGSPSQAFFVYYSPFIAIATVSIFLLFIKIDIQHSKATHLIKFISDLTLGVYLVHPIIIDYFKIQILNSTNALSLLGMSFFIFIISLLITLIISKTPILKKTV